MAFLMKNKILITLTAVAMCTLLVQHLVKKESLTAPTTGNVLLVGTSDDYPPYTFNKDGEIVGFDIDLAREVARRMGMTMKLTNMSFDILLLELQKGRLQCIAAGLTPTQERAAKVFFTTPYLQGDPLLAVTRKDSPPITQVADMVPLKVIVIEGYTADFYLSKQKNINLERVETVAQAILSLERRKSDVFILSQSALQPFLKTKFQENFKTDTLPAITESYALAISKKHPDLLQKIELVLVELKEDGTLEDLKQKWELS